MPILWFNRFGKVVDTTHESIYRIEIGYTLKWNIQTGYFVTFEINKELSRSHFEIFLTKEQYNILLELRKLFSESNTIFKFKVFERNYDKHLKELPPEVRKYIDIRISKLQIR